jgi:16S rRNA (uracil1498-N3)-methyltransferase
MQVGDLLNLTDGKGTFYNAIVTVADARKCTFTIQQTTSTPARPYSIAIAIAPTKNIDRMEWLVEKAVESWSRTNLILCFAKTRNVKPLTTSA